MVKKFVDPYANNTASFNHSGGGEGEIFSQPVESRNSKSKLMDSNSISAVP